jgi:hypothetical protein
VFIQTQIKLHRVDKSKTNKLREGVTRKAQTTRMNTKTLKTELRKKRKLRSKIYIQIFVKTLTGKTITLEIEPSVTISELKELIYQRTGIPGKLMNISTGEKNIGSKGTLLENHISPDSTIYLTLRIIGGMKAADEEEVTPTTKKLEEFHDPAGEKMQASPSTKSEESEEAAGQQELEVSVRQRELAFYGAANGSSRTADAPFVDWCYIEIPLSYSWISFVEFR